jgi:hypothetical protein
LAFDFFGCLIDTILAACQVRVFLYRDRPESRGCNIIVTQFQEPICRHQSDDL